MDNNINFNPRPREGSDLASGPLPHLAQFISIHAPVKGATDTLEKSVSNVEISIHAPVKGAT